MALWCPLYVNQEQIGWFGARRTDLTLEPESAQRYVIEMLDSLRRQTEHLKYNRPRYMLLARKYGLSHAEIAAVLGMSEDAVRQAVRRAKGTPGMEFPE